VFDTSLYIYISVKHFGMANIKYTNSAPLLPTYAPFPVTNIHTAVCTVLQAQKPSQRSIG